MHSQFHDIGAVSRGSYAEALRVTTKSNDLEFAILL